MSRWNLVAFAAAFVVVAVACGDDAGSDAPAERPVAITLANLEGYWAGVPPSLGDGDASRFVMPTSLHVRRALPDEDWAEWVAEVDGDYGVATLEGTTLRRSNREDAAGISDQLQILEATASTITLTSGAVLQRQDGCAAPGSFVRAPGLPRDAAIAGDGAVHMLQGEDFLGERSRAHLWRRPGDCAFRRDGSLDGMALAATEDGTVYVVRQPDATRPPTLVIATRASGTWTYAEEVLPVEASGNAYAIAFDATGEPVVFSAAGAAVSATRRLGGSWVVEPTNARGGGLTTPVIRVERDDRGTLYVRNAEWARFIDGAWEAWAPPARPGGGQPVPVFTWLSDGSLLGAWSDGPSQTYPATWTGRWDGAAWQDVRVVGMGQPVAMRAEASGLLDIVTVPNTVASRMLTAIEASSQDPTLPARQAYAQVHTGTQPPQMYDSIFLWYPVVAFGPDGSMFVGNRESGVRVRDLERGSAEVLLDVDFAFDADVPGRVEAPALAQSCDANCVISMPWNEVVLVTAASDGGNISLGSSDDPYQQAVGHQRIADGIWAFRVIRTFSDATQANEARVDVEVRDQAVRTAIAIPEGQAPEAGGSPVALEAFGNGDVLTVVNAATTAIQRRGSDGAVVASADACGIRATEARVVEDGVAVVGDLAEACGALDGLSGEAIVWLDEALVPTAGVEIERADASVLTGAGELVQLRNQYDSSVPREWTTVDRISASGPAAQTELAMGRLDPNTAMLHGLRDGFLLVQEPTGVASYDTIGGVPFERTVLAAFEPDGTARWHVELPPSAFHVVQVDGGRIFLGLDPTAPGAVGDTVLEATDEEIQRNATWLLEVNPDDGAVIEQSFLPNRALESGTSLRRAGPGQWVVVTVWQGAKRYDAFVDGALARRWEYLQDGYNCFGGGCIYRETFMTPASAGGWWVMYYVDPGSVDLEGVEVGGLNGTTVLTRWDPAVAFSP